VLVCTLLRLRLAHITLQSVLFTICVTVVLLLLLQLLSGSRVVVGVRKQGWLVLVLHFELMFLWYHMANRNGAIRVWITSYCRWGQLQPSTTTTCSLPWFPTFTCYLGRGGVKHVATLQLRTTAFALPFIFW
jgi:hypothetical protein